MGDRADRSDILHAEKARRVREMLDAWQVAARGDMGDETA